MEKERKSGRYIYGKNKELIRVAKYKQEFIMSLNEIYPDNPKLTKSLIKTTKKFKKGDVLQRIYGVHTNSALVRQIFREYFKNMLVDVLEGNCMYIFPYPTRARIFVGDKFDRTVRGGIRHGITPATDLLIRDYKVPELNYIFSPNSTRAKLNIYVHKSMYARFIEVANTGKIFSRRPKTMEHFMPFIYKKYDYIKKDSLDKIVRFILIKVAYNLRRGEEVDFVEKAGLIRIHRVLGKKHDEVMEDVVDRRKVRIKNKEAKEKAERLKSENKDNDTR